MASTGVVLCSLFVIGLFVYGIAETRPHGAALAGAVTIDSPQTQEAINTCMRECMRSCVRMEGMEQQCLVECNPGCGA
jgi:hypothetical protein